VKKLTPIVITVILVAYLAIYLWIPFNVNENPGPWFGKILWAAVGAGAAGMIVAAVYTLIIRLKEIDKEEKDKDDLSKY
jgi:hypothetical protein